MKRWRSPIRPAPRQTGGVSFCARASRSNLAAFEQERNWTEGHKGREEGSIAAASTLHDLRVLRGLL